MEEYSNVRYLLPYCNYFTVVKTINNLNLIFSLFILKNKLFFACIEVKKYLIIRF